MTYDEIYARLKEKLPAAVIDAPKTHGEPFVLVKAESIADVCRLLRDDPTLAFDYPSCISGLDNGKEMWVVYHLRSIKHTHCAVLKAPVDRANPRIPSVMPIWRGADWHERETFDMYGVRFEGHPDLRRILLPEDWPGYPLRKDYEFPEEYQGIPLK